MSDRKIAIWSLVVSCLSLAVTVYSVFFSFEKITVPGSIVTGIAVLSSIFFGIRYRRSIRKVKEKTFSNGVFEVIAKYADNKIVYLTIHNISGNDFDNFRINVANNLDNYCNWGRPYIKNNDQKSIKENDKVVKEVVLNHGKTPFDIVINWGINKESDVYIIQI